MIRRSLGLSTLVLCLVLPAAAWAAPKVAVTPIDGDSGDVREAVAEALSGNDLVVIDKRDVNRAVNKIDDITELTERDARKLANALEADAVVHGKLEKGDGSKTLKFQLFVNGKKQKGFTVTFTNARSPKFRKALHDKMVKKIEAAGPAASEEDSEEAAEAPKAKKGKKAKAAAEEEEVAEAPKAKKGKKAKAAAEEEEEVAEAPKAKKGKAEKAEKSDKAEKTAKAEKPEDDKPEAAPEEDEPRAKKAAKSSDGDGEGEDGDEPRKAKKKKTAKVESDDEELGGSVRTRASSGGGRRPANQAALRVDLGGSFAKRSLTFNEDLAENEPSAFQGSPVPGGRVELEMYPLALTGSKGFLANLGIAADYDKTLGLKVNAEDTKLAVNMNHFSIGARYRMMFGAKDTSPTVTVGASYGRRAFLVQGRGDLAMQNSVDFPDTDYHYVAPSLAFRLPLGKRLAFTAGGEGLLMTTAGEIQKQSQYGKSKVLGFGGDAGLDVVFGRIAVRLAGEFTQVGFTFLDEGGDLANNRDGDPTDKDVGGATDRVLGGTVTLGVLY